MKYAYSQIFKTSDSHEEMETEYYDDDSVDSAQSRAVERISDIIMTYPNCGYDSCDVSLIVDDYNNFVKEFEANPDNGKATVDDYKAAILASPSRWCLNSNVEIVDENGNPTGKTVDMLAVVENVIDMCLTRSIIMHVLDCSFEEAINVEKLYCNLHCPSCALAVENDWKTDRLTINTGRYGGRYAWYYSKDGLKSIEGAVNITTGEILTTDEIKEMLA